MAEENRVGGSFRLAGSGTTVSRMGYGAMRLAGPHAFGPPRDEGAAVASLRLPPEVVAELDSIAGPGTG